MPKWTKIAKPDPRGHRFFCLTNHPDARIFVCDDSGEDPDTCEDKRMHLLRDNNIRATVDGHFLVQASTGSQEPTSFIASFTEAAWLCATYHMKIEHRGRIYQLLQVIE